MKLTKMEQVTLINVVADALEATSVLASTEELDDNDTDCKVIALANLIDDLRMVLIKTNNADIEKEEGYVF